MVAEAALISAAPGSSALARRSLAADTLWVIAAAAALLVPAILWGRPFVFGDTAYYWGWGGDVLDALQHPWPAPGQPWIAGRALHGWGYALHDATPADLRFDLTWLTARSSFYAVPFRLLTDAGGLWLVAGLQALLAAWAVKTAVRAAVPAAPAWAGFAIVAALSAVTSLGFEAAYAMPDVFGGLAVLAAVTLIAFSAGIGRLDRLGLAALMTYAVLAHAENSLNLAAAAALGALWRWRASGRLADGLRRAAPLAVALVVGLCLAVAGRMALDAAFGQPTRLPPFAAGRLLADGAAQPYLRAACPGARLAACDLADKPPAPIEYYLWIYPLEAPATVGDTRATLAQFDRLEARHVTAAEADQRERFVAEQGRLVVGALRTNGLAVARAAFANGTLAFVNFGTGRDFDTLHRLVGAGGGLRAQLDGVLPGGVECPGGSIEPCGRFDLDRTAAAHYAAVLGALVFIVIFRFRRRLALADGLDDFLALTLGLVLANAFLCGAISGPYARYQSRVEWLIPLGALLLVLQQAQRLRAPPGPQ